MPNFFGKFKTIRCFLDYTFHYNYPRKRQLFQDSILKKFLTSYSNLRPTSKPKLLFTAGPMGAGKSHSLPKICDYLDLDLHQMIKIDPDYFKEQLPEFHILKETNPKEAGSLCHLESCILSEIN